MTCETCAHWKYHYPNRGGVCLVGPVNPVGERVPVSAWAVGQELAHQYEGMMATAEDTICDLFELGYEITEEGESDKCLPAETDTAPQSSDDQSSGPGDAKPPGD